MGSILSQCKPRLLAVVAVMALFSGPGATPGLAQGEESSGRIVGQIIDSETGRTIAGATVAVKAAEARDAALRGWNYSSTTDFDGIFRIQQVPAGTYAFRLYKAGYQLVELGGIVVLPEEGPTRVNYALEPRERVASDALSRQEGMDIFELSAFEVTAEEMSQEQAAFIDLRRSATGTVDYLTTADFTRFAVSDLSGAVRKMPGINVVEGKFAVVRGMNDRFNSTLVNGLPVPSPDPLRQGVQLDLFPTSIIDNVVANKSFLPYMPGNTAGAGFELSTRRFPETFTSYFKAGFRFNTNAEDGFLEDPEKSSKDAFAMGKGERASIATSGEDGGPVKIQNNFLGKEASAPIGLTLGAGLGDTETLWGRKLGYVIALSYNSSAVTESEGFIQDWYAQRNFFSPPGFPGHNPVRFSPGDLYLGRLLPSGIEQYTRSVYSVLIGGLGAVSYDLDKKGLSRISAVFLGSQSADDKVRRLSEGFVPEGGLLEGAYFTNGVAIALGTNDLKDNLGYYYNEQVEYEERNLTVWQLKGEHLLLDLNDLQLHWGVSYAKTTSDVPRQTESNFLRYTTEFSNSVEPGFAVLGGAEGVGLFLQEITRSIDHDMRALRADVTQPFPFFNIGEAELRVGGIVEKSQRNVTGASIAFDSQGEMEAVRAETPYKLSLEIFDLPLGNNSGATPTAADVIQDIEAGYVYLELPINRKLELAGGLRYEAIAMKASGTGTVVGGVVGINGLTIQRILDSGRTGPTGEELTNGEIIGFTEPDLPGAINEDNLLPGLTLSYQPFTELKFIAGYSRTIARPSFRELSPYFDLEAQTGDIVMGNPNLDLVDVTSYDLRAEYIFAEGGVFSISAFSKEIENPIEQVLLRAGKNALDIRTFFNNPTTADVNGLELEFRRSLSFLGERWKDFSFGTNLSYIDAEVTIDGNFLSSYFQFVGFNFTPQGPFVGSDGPPLGIAEDRLPRTRRLFDQPEWIANADLTYSNEDWGFSATLSLYAQSSVLTAVGIGSPERNSVTDQYLDTYQEVNLSVIKDLRFLGEGASIRFAVTNLTDTRRRIIYDKDVAFADTYERLTYTLGQTYRLALQFDF